MNIFTRLITFKFLFLFFLSVSASAVPCTVVNSFGLFGEAKTTIIICEKEEEAAEAAVRQKYDGRQVKGINIINVWFILSVEILCLCYAQYRFELPGKDTIVTLKVRMDN